MSAPFRMTHKSSSVRRAVATALGAAAVGACLPAIAQEADDEFIEEIVTTGTILKRADTEALPISIITAEDMDLRGLNTLSDVALRLPQNNMGTITNNWNVGFNFATGATAPALRGLTVQSTLSIADGLRLAPYPLADDGQRNFVDLNTIPNTIIDRVEILRDGASSTYGADAIAGVVNVITKKEIQGFHMNIAAGFSQDGGGDEERFDISWGVGDLGSDGYNFYVAGEIMNQEKLNRDERGSPFNSADWTSICGPSGSCMPNYNWNGVTPEDGYWYGWFSDIPGVAYQRPIDPTGAVQNDGTRYVYDDNGTPDDPSDDFLVQSGGNVLSPYDFVNPADGCREHDSIDVASVGGTTTGGFLADGTPATFRNSNPNTACEWDYWGAHQLRPEIERKGLSMRFTKAIGDEGEFYAMANFYRTDTSTFYLPIQFDRGTTPPQGATYQGTYQAYAPVYVCSTGVGTADGRNTGCDETNGQLNPYNPYNAPGTPAALGMVAEIEYRADMGHTRFTDTTSRVSRVALGLSNTFADDWNYNLSYTFSEVILERTQVGGMIPANVADVLAQGTFDLMNPLDTPQNIWDYIMPENTVTSPSRLWMVDANIGRAFGELGGGQMQFALGVAYRDESINAPSANPANDSAPYERFTGYNSVGTEGQRDVSAAYFEFLAPFTDSFELMASGRYDDYSTGQDNFSPKISAKWSPTDSLAFRASWSEGFRIPSFNEAFGLPTTGYVARTVDCDPATAIYTDFCAAHAGNVYATSSTNLGQTSVGDPALDPEESESYSVGVIWNATDNLSITVDYWDITVDGLISSIPDTGPAEDEYYLNNGVVTIPGIVALPAPPDANFPNALPHLGFLVSAYQNQDSQTLNGWDFAINWNSDFGNTNWNSNLNAAYLNEFTLVTDDGSTLEYAGTLSPCSVTSCSGAPEWRMTWANSLFFNDDKTSATMTVYYTAGVDNWSVDSGGVKGDCTSASILQYRDGTYTDCKSADIWNVDVNFAHRINDSVNLYLDIMNAFDIEPEVDVSSAYHIYGFNPAWGGPNIMGRFFRLGARFDFE